MQGKSVLVIDDDPRLLQLVGQILRHAGAQVYTATDGPEGLLQFSTHQPDLIILDIMMPGMDGWETCRHIRQVSHVPIMMLTALEQSQHVVQGLKVGADDYLVKPFSADILVARAQALLRRAALPAVLKKPATYQDGYLTVDLAEHQVLVHGQPVKLTATEYRLLAYLLQHPNRVLTFQQILDNVWGAEYRSSIEYIHIYLSRLRQKLEEDPKHPHYLLSHHGVGYYFQKLMPTWLNPPEGNEVSPSPILDDQATKVSRT